MLTQKQAVTEIDQPVPEIDQINDPDNYNFNEVITQKQPMPEIDRINDPGNYKEVPNQKQPVPEIDPEIYPENDPENDNLSMHTERLLCKEVVNVKEMLDGKPESPTGNPAKRIQKSEELPIFGMAGVVLSQRTIDGKIIKETSASILKSEPLMYEDNILKIDTLKRIDYNFR